MLSEPGARHVHAQPDLPGARRSLVLEDPVTSANNIVGCLVSQEPDMFMLGQTYLVLEDPAIGAPTI